MIFVCTLILSVLSQQEGNEAKDLYDAMVKKMDSANTLQVKFKYITKRGNETGSFSGTVSLADKNRMRLELLLKSDREALKRTIVSDGVDTLELDGAGKSRGRSKSSENSYRILRGVLSRLGASGVGIYDRAGPESRENVDEIVSMSDFELGEKEKVDGRETQVVTCIVRVWKDEASMKVWIDSETGLPVKRSILISLDGNSGDQTIFETYVILKLDAKFPPDTFKLPEEASKDEKK